MTRCLQVACPGLLALAWLFAPDRAAAEPLALPPLVLEAPCITPADLETRVQPVLPANIVAATILQGVQVRVRPAEHEQEVEIVLPARRDQPTLTRTLRGETCETVVDAAILVIGLWVSESSQAAPPSAPAPAPAPTPVPGPAPARPEEDRDLEPLSISVLFGGALSSALLPRVAWGVELGGALAWRTFRLALVGRYWPSQAHGPSDEKVEADLIEGDLRLAWLPIELGALWLGPSVGLAAGELHLEGVAVTDPQPRSLLWWRSELAVVARWAVPGALLAFTLDAGVALPWSRPRADIAGQGTVFRPAALSPYAVLGLELVLN
jgi:hypothetical protein